MSKVFFVITAAFLTISSFAQGVQFEKGPWEEVLEKAKQEDKLMFVDSYTTWCGPCKKLSKSVFPDETVGKFFNDNFINLKLDMEKENGMSFGMKYRVSAYPTMFFIAGNGEVVYKVTGFRNPQQLINEAKTALTRYDRSDDFAKEYEAGERGVDFMIKYINELNKTGKESLKIANEYLKENKDISSEDRARFLFAAATESDSKLFEEMLKYDDFLINTYGKEKWDQKILSACSKTVDTAIEYEYPDLIDEATTQVKSQLGKTAAKKFECESCIEYYKSSGDLEEYQKFMKNYVNKIAKKDVVSLKWAIEDLKVSFGGETNNLLLARDAAKKVYKLEDSVDNGVLLAQLYYETGDQEEALKLLEKTKEKIKASGKTTRHIDRLIQKVKSS